MNNFKELESDIKQLRELKHNVESDLQIVQNTLAEVSANLQAAETQLAQNKLAESDKLDLSKDDELEIVGFTTLIDRFRYTDCTFEGVKLWAGMSPDTFIEPVVLKSQADARIKELSDLVISLGETQEQPLTLDKIHNELSTAAPMLGTGPAPLVEGEDVEITNTCIQLFNKMKLYEIPTKFTIVGFPANLSDDTVELVASFTTALMAKLNKAQQKHGFTSEWKYDNWEDKCRRDFCDHVFKGDPLDVAAYCAFMWFHGWSTPAQVTYGSMYSQIQANR